MEGHNHSLEGPAGAGRRDAGPASPTVDVLADALSQAEQSAQAQIFTKAEPPFIITHVNHAWVKLCGFSREEAVGQTCRILQGAGTNPETLRALHAAVAAQAPISVRLLNYTKTGKPFLNDLSLRPLCERTGTRDASHYVGTMRVWQQPEAHVAANPQALQTPEEAARSTSLLRIMPATLEAALRNSDVPQILTEANPPHRIVHVNQIWCEQCGYLAEDVLGQTCKMLQGPATCPETTKALGAAARSHKPISVKLVNYAKDGRPFMNTLSMAPLSAGRGLGGVTHMVALLQIRFLEDSVALYLASTVGVPTALAALPPAMGTASPIQLQQTAPRTTQAALSSAAIHVDPAVAQQLLKIIGASIAPRTALPQLPAAAPQHHSSSFVTASPSSPAPSAQHHVGPPAVYQQPAPPPPPQQLPPSAGVDYGVMPPPLPRTYSDNHAAAAREPPPPPAPSAAAHHYPLPPAAAAFLEGAARSSTQPPPHSDAMPADSVLPLLSAVAAARAHVATEASEEAPEGATDPGGAPRVDALTVEGRLAPFLTKLYNLVSAPDTDDAIRWASNGQSLLIVDPARLSRDVLPRFFKHNKMGTFTQQLYTYGFVRRGNDSPLATHTTFCHEHFRRDAPHELYRIHRSVNSVQEPRQGAGQTSSAPPPPAPLPSTLPLAAAAASSQVMQPAVRGSSNGRGPATGETHHPAGGIAARIASDHPASASSADGRHAHAAVMLAVASGGNLEGLGAVDSTPSVVESNGEGEVLAAAERGLRSAVAILEESFGKYREHTTSTLTVLGATIAERQPELSNLVRAIIDPTPPRPQMRPSGGGSAEPSGQFGRASLLSVIAATAAAETANMPMPDRVPTDGDNGSEDGRSENSGGGSDKGRYGGSEGDGRDVRSGDGERSGSDHRGSDGGSEGSGERMGSDHRGSDGGSEGSGGGWQVRMARPLQVDSHLV